MASWLGVLDHCSREVLNLLPSYAEIIYAREAHSSFEQTTKFSCLHYKIYICFRSLSISYTTNQLISSNCFSEVNKNFSQEVYIQRTKLFTSVMGQLSKFYRNYSQCEIRNKY